MGLFYYYHSFSSASDLYKTEWSEVLWSPILYVINSSKTGYLFSIIYSLAF